jgi:hypothetical protein
VPKQRNAGWYPASRAQNAGQKGPHPTVYLYDESADLQVKKRLMGFEPTTFCMAIRQAGGAH